MLTLAATIVLLGVLIFIHELGHFLAAKLSGIRVERFSLGFPPRAFGKKIGDTDYCISWIPLGGYVKMSGMIDESLQKEEAIKGEPWEFQSKPGLLKFFTISAGPVMNLILGIFLFSVITFSSGISELDQQSVMGFVVEDGPAYNAGMKQGDRIVEINGQKVETWKGITDIIHNRPNTTLNIVWMREDSRFEKDITTTQDTVAGKTYGVIKVGQNVLTRPAGLFESISYGGQLSVRFFKLVVTSISNVISGKESLKKSFGGPVMIAQLAGESARQGLLSYLSFMAILSLNLALLNLLPFPVLDGGHLVFILIEAIIRRPVPNKIKLVILQIGMAFILIFTIFILYNDFARVLQ